MPDLSSKITTARPYGAPSKVLQNAMESDRGRIINSSAIRRLQQKTQVFPLERNAEVRSRLTHSLEVQQVGRFIVQQIDYKLSRDSRYNIDDHKALFRAIESLVEMACLMHDIGTPPFGYFGEKAIQDWFAQHINDILPRPLAIADPVLFQQAHTDVMHFEGYAQAIRQVASLQNLNLTYSQTATILKYTRPAFLPKSDVDKAKSFLMHKPGYFLSEKLFIEELYQSLSMDKGCRHPLSYVMEAADHISYCFADIEDAVEKDVLAISELMNLLPQAFSSMGGDPDEKSLTYFGSQISFNDMLAEAKLRHDKERVDSEHQFFIALRVKLQHILVEHAASRFIDSFEQVVDGTFNYALLDDDSAPAQMAAAFKRVAQQHVFCHPEVELQELRGHHMINGLLDYYAPLLMLPHELFAGIVKGDSNLIRRVPREKRLFNKLPKKHIRAYQDAIEHPPGFATRGPEIWERYCRCRLIQDFISSMTDQFAYDEYKSLTVQD